MFFYIFFECLVLITIVYFLFILVYYKELIDFESMSPYECGFDPKSITRMTFSYRFFLISILFIIFDVEISLMLPIPYLYGKVAGLWIFNIFVMILILGLVYEYHQGSLDWLDNFISKA